jgi:hypothetical protein
MALPSTETVAKARRKTRTETAQEVVSKILTEDVRSLSQARIEIAEITGQRPDKATLTRWIHRGVGGVKLEAIRLGGRDIFTSVQAINRFIVARSETLTH